MSQYLKILLNHSNEYFNGNISELLTPKMKTVCKGYKMRKGKLPALKCSLKHCYSDISQKFSCHWERKCQPSAR